MHNLVMDISFAHLYACLLPTEKKLPFPVPPLLVLLIILKLACSINFFPTFKLDQNNWLITLITFVAFFNVHY